MSQSPSTSESALTPAVKAVIGATAEKIEASLPWGNEREGLRIFTQAIMDPDPRYWLGFDIATGIFGDPALGAQGNTQSGPGSLGIRDALSPASKRGFNAAMELLLK